MYCHAQPAATGKARRAGDPVRFSAAHGRRRPSRRRCGPPSGVGPPAAILPRSGSHRPRVHGSAGAAGRRRASPVARGTPQRHMRDGGGRASRGAQSNGTTFVMPDDFDGGNSLDAACAAERQKQERLSTGRCRQGATARPSRFSRATTSSPTSSIGTGALT
jgi:hypothetical protein